MRWLTRRRSTPLPDGLESCPHCSEPRGHATFSDTATGGELQVDVACICDGVACSWCGQMPVRRPASSRYDATEAQVRHSGTWASAAPCAHCRADGAAAAPHASVAVCYDIGATPFLGETDATDDYFTSPRYRLFEASLPDLASAHGVTLLTVNRVQGLWQGRREPSAMISVRGSAPDVLAMMVDIADRWGQEGVVGFSADLDGAARMHTASTALTADEVCGMLGGDDVPDVTVGSDGTVMILDIQGHQSDRARRALARLEADARDVEGHGFVHLRADAR